jgi:hypothetical protein
MKKTYQVLFNDDRISPCAKFETKAAAESFLTEYKAKHGQYSARLFVREDSLGLPSPEQQMAARLATRNI